MRDNSSVLFQLKLYMLLTKVAHESANFQTCHCSGENSPNSSCHFWNQESIFFSNFASPFSARKHNSSVFFYLNFICFGQKNLIKVQIFRLSTACMKINPIPYVIFQATCQFSFKICINFQCHDT